jgi:hypothetical protein
VSFEPSFPLLTINPRVGADDGIFWEPQLRYLSLNQRILHHNLLDQPDLIIVDISMDERTESDVAFDCTHSQVHNSFVEAILVQS